jgi:hypothetical protein
MGSLTVHVVDDEQNPLEGKRVFCNFVGSFLGLADTHTAEFTDEEGVAEFYDVPVGSVEIIVGGVQRLSVGVGQNDHEDVTVTI